MLDSIWVVPGQPQETLGGLVLLFLELVGDKLLKGGRLARGSIEALLDFLELCELKLASVVFGRER